METGTRTKLITDFKANLLKLLTNTNSIDLKYNPPQNTDLNNTELIKFTKTQVFPICRHLWEDLLDNEILLKLQDIVLMTNHLFPTLENNPIILLYYLVACLIKSESDLLQIFQEQDEDDCELEMDELSYINSDQIIGLMTDIIDGTEYTSADDIPVPISSLKPNVELLWKCWRELEIKLTIEQKKLLKKEWFDLITSSILLIETDTIELSKRSCNYFYEVSSGFRFILECYFLLNVVGKNKDEEVSSEHLLSLVDKRNDVVFKRMLVSFGKCTTILKSIIQLDKNEGEFKNNFISRIILLEKNKEKCNYEEIFQNAWNEFEIEFNDFCWAIKKLQAKYFENDCSRILEYIKYSQIALIGQMQYLINCKN